MIKQISNILISSFIFSLFVGSKNLIHSDYFCKQGTNHYCVRRVTFCCHVLPGLVLIDEVLGLSHSVVGVEDLVQPWVPLLLVQKLHKLLNCQVRLFLSSSDKRTKLYILFGGKWCCKHWINIACKRRHHLTLSC